MLEGRISRVAPDDYVLNQQKWNTFHRDGQVEHYAEDALGHLARFLGTIANRPTSVLDAGCRVGYCLTKLMELFPSARVVGVDVVPAFVEMSTDTGAEVHNADVCRLPFSDGEFDITFCNQTLEHCYDPTKGLAELCRVTKYGLFVGVPLEGIKTFEANPSHYARSGNPLDWLELFRPHYPQWMVMSCYTITTTGEFGIIAVKPKRKDDDDSPI